MKPKYAVKVWRSMILVGLFTATTVWIKFGMPVEGVYYRGPVDRPVVALTFDDCGSPENISSILDELKLKQVLASFFVTGDCVTENYELILRMKIEGHLIGSHTLSHPHMSKLSLADARKEIVETHKIFLKYGIDERPYFRFPYGDHSSELINLIRELGYNIYFWSLDSRSVWGKPELVIDRIDKKTQNGYIILMHLNAPADVAALSGVIDILRINGLTPVRLDDLFK